MYCPSEQTVWNYIAQTVLVRRTPNTQKKGENPNGRDSKFQWYKIPKYANNNSGKACWQNVYKS